MKMNVPARVGSSSRSVTREASSDPSGPLDLSMRRSSEGSTGGDLVVDLDSDHDSRRTSPAPPPPPPPLSQLTTAAQEDEDVEVEESEDIVCAPSIPSLLLSTSSTCSSPSPPPPASSPALSSSSQSNIKRGPGSVSSDQPSKRPRTESGSNSPSPKSQQASPKSPRRGTPNGVIAVNNNSSRTSSNESASNSHRKALAVALSQHLSQADANSNLSNLLLAAVAASSAHRDDAGGNGAPLLKSPPVPLSFSGKVSSKNPGITKTPHLTSIIPPPILLPNPQTTTADLLSTANIIPLLTSEMALRMASEAAAVVAPPPPPPPQVLVKQGVSKCRECNIVFCKHENYMAHKKHYCSARLEGNTSGGDDGGAPSPQGGVPSSPSGNTSNCGSPPHIKDRGRSTSPTTGSSSGQQAGQKPPTLFQFICAACGIKFTSFDNLTAHQAYYCPKRAELITKSAPEQVVDKSPASALRKCVKCKVRCIYFYSKLEELVKNK